MRKNTDKAPEIPPDFKADDIERELIRVREIIAGYQYGTNGYWYRYKKALENRQMEIVLLGAGND